MAAEAPGRSRRRFTLESAAFSYAAVAFAMVQGILLVPMYLRYMPQELYGAWLASGAILAWVELADPGVGSILQQRIAFMTGKAGAGGAGVLIGTGLAAACCLAALPALAWSLPGLLAGWIGVAPHLVPELVVAFRIGLASVGLNILLSALVAVSLGLQEVRSVSVVSLLGIVAGVAVTVVGLLAGAGLAALPLGALARSVVASAGTAAVVSRLLRQQAIPVAVSLAAARGILGEVAFTFTSRVGVALLSRLDALMSAKLLSPASTVVLTLTGRAVDLVRLGADRLAAAAMPALAHFAGERGATEARRVQGLVSAYTALVLGVLGGTAIAWNGHFVRLWVGEERFGGIALTVALVVHGCLASYVSSIAQSVFALGGIRETAVIGLVEAGARLALQLLLVASLGLVGFPIAALGALALISVPLLLVVTARRFGGTVAAHTGTLGRALVAMAALLAAGWAVGGLAVWRPSWIGLAAGSVATAAALLGVALALFPDVRRDAARAWAARRHR